MIPRSEAEIRARYADLLGPEQDDELASVVQTLDSGYSLQRAPAELRSRVPHRLPGGDWRVLDDGGDISMFGERQARARRTRVGRAPRSVAFLVSAAGIISLLTVGVVLAVSNITNLGKPTNSLPPAPASVLDGFARKGPFLRQAGKPELLFIGTQVTSYTGGSAIEEWALVKALGQFGRLSDVKATTTHSCEFTAGDVPQCYPSTTSSGYPTFDFSHARYTSRYLALVYKELIDESLHVNTNFSPEERSLLQRYIRQYVYIPSSRWDDFAWYESIMPPYNRGLPLISIDGYLRVDSGAALIGDLTPTNSDVPVAFSAVQASLRTGKATGGAPSSLVPDVNAEVNVLTALICHADRSQPHAVCARAPVLAVLKHLK